MRNAFGVLLVLLCGVPGIGLFVLALLVFLAFNGFFDG